jgi:hypothetical protein
MIFRFTSLESAFASAAMVTAAALVTTGAIATDSDVAFNTSPLTSEGDANDVYVPQKISNKQDVVVNDIHSVGKEGIELSLHLENQIKEKTNTRELRNNRELSGSKGDNDKLVDHNTIDLGVLANAIPTDTKGERRRELTTVDYCYDECGSNRMVIPSNSTIKSLVNYCESSGNCGDCYGDGDNIDYRGPSQIKCWNTSEVTNMEKAFKNNSEFNDPLRCWDVSSVTSMYSMFEFATSFNQNINDWDVSSVQSTRSMFTAAYSFDNPLQSWDVSSVSDMESMFFFASSFNQPLDKWDPSSLLDTHFMFDHAKYFNQCLSSWKHKLPTMISTTAFYNTACPYIVSFKSFCQGPDQNCFFTKCNDNETFRFEGEDSQDCEWVAAEHTQYRCSQEKVFEKCAKTCNPVCPGSSLSSPPTSSPTTSPNSPPTSSPTTSPTTSPTNSPTAFCSNDPDFGLNGVKAKSCEWVAKQKTSERCKKPGVMDACRQTCNPVCAAAAVDCTDDPDFRLNGINGKSCEWVERQKTNKRCKKAGVMDSCRRTCNPSCGCTDSTDEFEFQGSMITCEDLHINYCDAELISSGDQFFEQIQDMLDEVLISIHEKFDVVNQRLDVIEDAVVEDVVVEEITTDSVFDRKTYMDLCPNKCKKCMIPSE